MEEFKVKHFRSAYPDKQFPKYFTVEQQELLVLQKKLFNSFLDEDSSLESLMETINSSATIIDAVNALDDDFNLLEFFLKQNIEYKEIVFLNWYRFDDIDKIKTADLNNHFSDIWYPSSDDIDLFDESFSWMVSIRHDGVLSLIRANK